MIIISAISYFSYSQTHHTIVLNFPLHLHFIQQDLLTNIYMSYTMV